MSDVLNDINLDYGVKDIKTLEGIEAIRLRPGMYNYLSRIHKYTNCKCKKGDECNESRCMYSIMTLQLAAQFCGGNSSTISAVCRGKRNSHKNYIWRYLD